VETKFHNTRQFRNHPKNQLFQNKTHKLLIILNTIQICNHKPIGPQIFLKTLKLIQVCNNSHYNLNQMFLRLGSNNLQSLKISKDLQILAMVLIKSTIHLIKFPLKIAKPIINHHLILQELIKANRQIVQITISILC
jgi:hypothetical protein